MKLLGEYKNGNYTVSIYDDGTKVRENDLDNLTPSFPENIDIKITNYCEYNCPMCHEKSSKEGKHGKDIMCHEFIRTLRPYTELAIGGGEAILHPDLIDFLFVLKQKNIISNITTKQESFMENKNLLEELIKDKFIYWLGDSISKYDEDFIDEVIRINNTYNGNIVLHMINGYHSYEEIMKYKDKGLKVLLLGYKEFGRGLEYSNKGIYDEIELINDNLSEILKSFKLISFDNLALKQLDLKRFLTEEEWNEFYMGDDGNYTMYIDLVEEKFGENSTSEVRDDLLNNIDDMFNIVRGK